jgi:peptide deformylase
MSPIVKIGHPALRTHLHNLSTAWIKRPDTKKLVNRMFRLMRQSNGVGLAANQLGLPHRLFVMQCEGNPRYPGKQKILSEVFFNPRIMSKSSRKALDWEGCLSIPGYRGLTPRAESVVLEAILLNGQKIRREYTGFAARIVQHETDHLDGYLYVDRMKNLTMWMHEDEMKD